MVNKIILLGNLGKDPEVKHLDNNKAVCTLTLATSERYTDRNGNKVEQTEWHRLELWDGLAKVAEKYLHKGDKIFVEGSIKTEEWEKDGIKRHITKIRVKNLQMISGKSNTAAPQNSDTSNVSDEALAGAKNEDDSDLPF